MGTDGHPSITVWTYIRTGHNAEVANLTFSGNKLVKIELNLLRFRRAKDCVMSLSHPLRLSRRTLLRQLGATGVLVTLRSAGVWATQAMVQQAVRDRIGTREPQPVA